MMEVGLKGMSAVLTDRASVRVSTAEARSRRISSGWPDGRPRRLYLPASRRRQHEARGGKPSQLSKHMKPGEHGRGDDDRGDQPEPHEQMHCS